MRIVHVATSDMAIRYLLLDQIRYLASRGHDVSAASGSGPWVGAVRASGVRLDTVPLTRRVSVGADVRALTALARLFVDLRPDIVHTHTPKASLLGQWAALLARVPYRVHTIHGLYLPARSRGLARRTFLWLERLTMAPAHLVLSQNAEDLETCRRERLAAPSKLRPLGNGVDLDRFHPPDPARRDSIRAALGIAPGTPVVGIVARLVREKGYLDLFAAVPKVVERVPGTVFLVVGGVEPEKEDRIDPSDERITRLGTAVRLLGHRDDVADLYPAMDLLALPSHREGFPRAPMEAAATGIPVVATDIRGCREAVVEGETGRLVPLGDVESLARALADLLEDEPRRRAMGAAARALAERRFDQRDVFERIAAAYDELAASGPERAGRDARDARTGGNVT